MNATGARRFFHLSSAAICLAQLDTLMSKGRLASAAILSGPFFVS